MKSSLLFLSLIFLSVSLFAQPKQEIRAVWLTTNYGLDWPSKPLKSDSDIPKQKEELDEILTQLKAANINVVFVQTRLRGDLIYSSSIEPQSSHVKANYFNSDYDMLEYAIEACHEKGIECHAWFVTYPLGAKTGAVSPVVRNKKHLVKTFRDELFLDPGNPETDTYLLSLVSELVCNYDIDGIHFDYIRYPDNAALFPDDSSYKQFGGKQNKADWRRANISRFVYSAYDLIKTIKPWVQVSSSVVGMYQKIGNGRTHWTAYHDVYQDPADWFKNGKHDFIVPMMYYSDDLFFPFVDDWKSRSNGRYIIPGLGLYQMDEKEMDWPSETILQQIRHSREKGVQGNAFYRMKFLRDNKKGILDEVKKLYSTPAVLPALSWLSDSIPDVPRLLEVTSNVGQIYFQWEATDSQEKMIFYNLYRSSEFPVDTENPGNLIESRLPVSRFALPLDNSIESGYYYVVTSYDRFHNESEASFPVYFVTGDFEK